ncbi:hypothetical protein EVA_16284 [gut metagenome]|uniref:Uncharacterized protein n=1 Tax=gut metagenome TaxID=749906 RepID=J9G1D0_9ZZZZ
MKEEITSYSELREMADKFELLESTGILDMLRDVLNDIPTAMVECSCLQQFVIDSTEEADKMPDNFPHIRYALQRLMNMTNAVYYNQKELHKLLQ